MPLIKNKVSQHDEGEQIFNNTTQENCPERKGLMLPVEEDTVVREIDPGESTPRHLLA